MKSYERDASAKVLRMECDSDELPLSFDDLRGCSTDAEADRLWAAGVPAVAPGWRIVVALELPERAAMDLITFGSTELKLGDGEVVTDETIHGEMMDAYHRSKAKEGAGA